MSDAGREITSRELVCSRNQFRDVAFPKCPGTFDVVNLMRPPEHSEAPLLSSGRVCEPANGCNYRLRQRLHTCFPHPLQRALKQGRMIQHGDDNVVVELRCDFGHVLAVHLKHVHPFRRRCCGFPCGHMCYQRVPHVTGQLHCCRNVAPVCRGLERDHIRMLIETLSYCQRRSLSAVQLPAEMSEFAIQQRGERGSQRDCARFVLQLRKMLREELLESRIDPA
mmetsp:Transcript_35380/g.109144  ORF Transcript_35380/g.109144 Transcript_35380/m.109144 type:complete len:223 (-) Transcript_35380:548-1216(-)